MRIKNIWLSTETVDKAKKIDVNTSTETIKNMKSLYLVVILAARFEHKFTHYSQGDVLFSANNDTIKLG